MRVWPIPVDEGTGMGMKPDFMRRTPRHRLLLIANALKLLGAPPHRALVVLVSGIKILPAHSGEIKILPAEVAKTRLFRHGRLLKIKHVSAPQGYLWRGRVRSVLRTAARYECLPTTFGAKGLAMSRTIKHMNPPATVPHIAGAGT